MTEPTIDITKLRRALIDEADQAYQHRRGYSDTWRAENRHPDQDELDAYEAHVAVGTYGWTLAGILRILADRHPDTAAEIAAIVADAAENGTEYLDHLNADLATDTN